MGDYFDPDNLGLVLVAAVSLDDEPYQFDLADVWYRPEDGHFYAASDRGCSCPMPFERIESLGDLEGPFSRASAMSWMRNRHGVDRGRIIDAVEKIRNFDKPSA